MRITQKTLYIFNLVCIYVLVGLVVVFPWQSLPNPTSAQALVQSSRATERRAQEVSGIPQQLRLPRLGINLAVVVGEYSNDSWTLSPNKAVYARVTQKPGNVVGNTVMYGHNTPGVLYNTKNIEAEELLFLTLDNGYQLRYRFLRSETVSPNDTSVLMNRPQVPMLTLLTCDGFLDSTRKLMYFVLDDVTQI